MTPNTTRIPLSLQFRLFCLLIVAVAVLALFALAIFQGQFKHFDNPTGYKLMAFLFGLLVCTLAAGYFTMRNFLVASEKGLWVAFLTREPLPWALLASFACVRERNRPMLRVFLRPGAETDPRLKREGKNLELKPSAAGLCFDVNFVLAQGSGASLVTAQRACSRWIA